MEKVDVHPLKAFVAKKLPYSSVLRAVILNDDDFMEPWDYVAKIKIWLTLLEVDVQREKSHVDISPFVKVK